MSAAASGSDQVTVVKLFCSASSVLQKPLGRDIKGIIFVARGGHSIKYRLGNKKDLTSNTNETEPTTRKNKHSTPFLTTELDTT